MLLFEWKCNARALPLLAADGTELHCTLPGHCNGNRDGSDKNRQVFTASPVTSIKLAYFPGRCGWGSHGHTTTTTTPVVGIIACARGPRSPPPHASDLWLVFFSPRPDNYTEYSLPRCQPRHGIKRAHAWLWLTPHRPVISLRRAAKIRSYHNGSVATDRQSTDPTASRRN